MRSGNWCKLFTASAICRATAIGCRDLTVKILYPRLAGVIALLAIASISGCATDKAKVYSGEEFHATGVYSHKFAASSVATCEAARRTLLSQGYIVADIKADLVNGQKSFQPDGDTHVEIAFHVVCVSDGPDGKSSTAFVNALQDRYAIKKTPSSASLGVGAVGAVSLPFGSSDDSLVKVASETIPPGPIYDRFFELTDNYLKQIGKDFGPEPTHDKPKSAELPKPGPEALSTPAAAGAVTPPLPIANEPNSKPAVRSDSNAADVAVLPVIPPPATLPTSPPVTATTVPPSSPPAAAPAESSPSETPMIAPSEAGPTKPADKTAAPDFPFSPDSTLIDS